MKASLSSIPFASVFGVAALMVGCGADPSSAPTQDDVQGSQDSQGSLADDGQSVRPRMHWTPQDNPSRLDSDLTYKYSELPTKGEPTRKPWPGNYWPTYQDNLNYKWEGAGTLSPAGKYATATGLDVKTVEDAISKHYGVESQSHRKACTETSECDSSLGESCSKREGEESGYCIPTWFGICHAWAPAAIAYEEPKEAVERGGVKFWPNDIKALLSLAHDQISSHFTSSRCNENNSAGEIEYDDYGRPVLVGGDAACIDTNPGTLLILLGNKIGLRGESFIEDRTFDAEVWNQPIAWYDVTKSETVTAKEANALIGVFGEGSFKTEESGTIAKGKWEQYGPYTLKGGEKLQATMTGLGDADLYVRTGAAPTATEFDCRPYEGSTNETCEITAPAEGAQVYVSVFGYADSSDYRLKVAAVGETPSTYKFNRGATDFRNITLKLAYITESAATAAGYLSDNIERYERVETYTAIIELNAAGNVIGGEWTGSSKQNHPDFLWDMKHVIGTERIAGGIINYDTVMSLYNESIGGGASTDGTPQSVDLTDAVARGRWKFYGPYAVEAGTTFTAKLSGTVGDADLYVRGGQKPGTSAGEWDCRPYMNGSNESCSVKGASEYYVGVRGYTRAEYTLDVDYVGSGDSGTDTGTPVFSHLDESGTLATNGTKRFTLNLSAGQKVTVKTESTSDMDLYLKLGSAPTLSNYDERGYTSSGNESLTITATSAQTLNIMVHAYQAGNFRVFSTDG